MTVPGLSVGRMRVNGVIDPGLVSISTDEEGKEILSFPVKALREQILNCINCLPGGEFVAGSEIKKVLKGWNGQPITINHPRNDRGDLEFANRDDVFLESVKVGFIDNARWAGGFLWVDAHLDRVLAATTVEGRGIIAALLTGASDVEVSTGYGMELEFNSGRFDGQRYHFTQTEIQPDHLALLPIGIKGACRVEDGCGAARAAQAGLRAAAAGDDPSGVEELAARLVRLIGAGATISPDDGDTEEPGAGGTPESHEHGGENMDRNVMILALVAAASVPFSREELDGYDDECLTKLATLAGLDCGCSDGDPGDDDAVVARAAAAAAAAAALASANADGDGDAGSDAGSDDDDERVTLSKAEYADFQLLLSARDTIVESANEARTVLDAERTELVTALAANDRCAVSEEDLKAMKLSALRGLSKTFAVVDYSGRGGPRSLGITDESDGGYMPLPVALVRDAGNQAEA